MAEVSAWRKQLQPGSFRGVPFSVQSAEGQIGRRNVQHEYPLRDIPYSEDLGRKAREFTFEALIVGPDYMTGRDKLIAAIEQVGSGELVHPYRGRLQVVVTSAKVSESTAEGGLAKFSLTFVESGENLNPAPVVDTKAAVNAVADDAKTASTNSFSDLFDVSGFQDFVSESGLSDLNNSLNSIRLAANEYLSSGFLPEFTSQIFGVANSISSLMMFPANLASSVFGQIQSLSGIANSPLAAFSALQGLFSFGNHSAPIVTGTPSRTQQAVNQAAVNNLVKRAAVIEAARVATQITPASYNEAVLLRDIIANQLESLAETAPDQVYSAMLNLRIAVIKDINARAADLSRTVEYFVPTTMPALVLAYRLYGVSATIEDAAAAIVSRNHIANPGFVPGGQPIEVLTS